MTKQELINWATTKGWTLDRWGHLRKNNLRMKLQKRTVRLEREYRTPDTRYSKGEKRYLRLHSSYYSKLTVSSSVVDEFDEAH